MIPFEDIYHWLNKFNPSQIHPSSAILISQVNNSLDEGRLSEASGLLQQLMDFVYKLRDYEEVTEILIECANISYHLDNFTKAETILVDTVSRAWSDLHRRGVIQWMLGCVQWHSMPARLQAVISWRNSLSDFEQLARQAGLPADQHAWYQDTCLRLEHSLAEAMQQIGSYIDIQKDHSAGTVDIGSHQESVHISVIPQMSGSAQTQVSDILQLFTISEEIPAGDFGPSGIDPFPVGIVEIDQVSINGHPYNIHSTRGRRIISLPLDQTCSVVKVKGDSMNQENITEQDFVLLRRVDMPSNGDIVMAEIVGVDSTATLKRYFKEKDTITLQPNSSNPVHKPFVFKKVDKGFYIRGIVLAVLKPI